MKKSITILVAFLVTLALVAYFFTVNGAGVSLRRVPAALKQSQPSPVTKAEIVEAEPVAKPLLVSDTTSTTPLSRPEATKEQLSQFAPARTIEDFLCDPRWDCRDWLLQGENEEEVRWLIRYGYPSLRLLELYDTISMEDLSRMSGKGDLAAMALLGRRQLELGHYSVGMRTLQSAVLRGSVYAYYELSRAARELPEHVDVIESGAYLRLALLVGDENAADGLYYFWGLGSRSSQRLLFEQV